VVFSGEGRVDFVHNIDSLQTLLFGESERNEQIHSLTTLRDAEEASILLREVSRFNLTCKKSFNVIEAPHFFHENLTVFASSVRGSACCDNKAFDLAQTALFLVETSELDHVVTTHEPGPIAQSSCNSIWLFHHLHDVVVADTWRQLDYDSFLNNCLDPMGLHLASQAQS